MPLQPSQTGRTPWDLIVQMAHQRGLLIFVGTAVLAIAVSTVAAIALVTRAAEGGSQITLLYGLVTYTKERASSSPSSNAGVKPTPAPTHDYIYPSSRAISANRAIVLLDGTINIFQGDCVYTRPDGGDLDCEIVIAGANQQLIHSAARAKSAQPAGITYREDRIVFTGFPTFIEIEYKGNTFEIEVERKSDSGSQITSLVGVRKISAPKMQLKPRLAKRTSIWSCIVDA